MEWTPIKREQVEVVGWDPKDEELLKVRVILSAEPNIEWVSAFLGAVGSDLRNGHMRPPLPLGQEVWLSPRESELDAYVHKLDEWLAGANTRYEQNARSRLTPAQRDEKERRLAKAREEAEKL